MFNGNNKGARTNVNDAVLVSFLLTLTNLAPFPSVFIDDLTVKYSLCLFLP